MQQQPGEPAAALPRPWYKRRAAILGGVAVLLVAGVIVGVKAMNADPNEGTQPAAGAPAEPVPSEASPGAEATPESFVPTRAEIEIQAGLDDEQFGREVISRQSDWLNAGNEDLLRERRLEANENWSTFLPLVVAENADAYAPALFGDEWRANLEVAPYVEKMTAANLGNMKAYVATAWNREARPENIEAYRYTRQVTAVDVLSSDDQGRILEIHYDNVTNSDKNEMADMEKKTVVLSITSKVVGGVEIITSITGL